MNSTALNFTAPPQAWRQYPSILVSRKPALLAEGVRVPRIEARLSPARIDLAHLRAYSDVCGFSRSDHLPLTYPHVLASGLHLALLSSSGFPIKLLGLVHVRNCITQREPLRADSAGSLHCFLEGHRVTERGQEFELHTSWLSGDGSTRWQEVSTFLARSAQRSAAPRGAASAVAEPASAVQSHTTGFHASAGLGRRYGWIAGDLNPIHLSDISARLFGFRAAIAHGMWSLARCVAEFPAQELEPPLRLDAAFKLPIFLPSWLLFTRSRSAVGSAFTLHDSEGQKPHLAGTLAQLP